MTFNGGGYEVMRQLTAKVVATYDTFGSQLKKHEEEETESLLTSLQEDTYTQHTQMTYTPVLETTNTVKEEDTS